MKLYLSLLLTLYCSYSYGQSITGKYSREQVTEDFLFIKKNIRNAHADPYNELGRSGYNALLDSVSRQLTDSMSAIGFLRLVKPLFAFLSDEHAGIEVRRSSHDSFFILPVEILKVQNGYVLDSVYSKEQAWKRNGLRLISLNDIPIEEVLSKCALYCQGPPEQRSFNAIAQFGYLLPFVYNRRDFNLQFEDSSVIPFQADPFLKYTTKHNNQVKQYDRNMLTYTYSGKTGYINAPTFLLEDRTIENVGMEIDAVFKEINEDEIDTLVIDVSRNKGGNSLIGDIIISYIFDKPYSSYSCNWRKSNQYIEYARKTSILLPENYLSVKTGKMLHQPSVEILPKNGNSNRFNGKVYILIGKETYSSAMIFSTLIKDNHIATLIGTTTENAHSDHYGQVFSANTPNLNCYLHFGVKKFIRPAGTQKVNILLPDFYLEFRDEYNIDDLRAALKSLAPFH